MVIFNLLSAAANATGAAPQNKFGFAEALEQGGFIAYATVIILGIIHRRCERRLVNSRASGRLRHARRPPPRALMGVVIGFVVVGKRRHPPRRRL